MSKRRWSRLVAVPRGYLYLLALFVTLRLGALVLFRPGGFITDFSDYDFYYTWGTLTPMGYRAYDNLWTAYPPLFPLIMLAAFEWSARIPAWIEPRLFFHLIFGAVLLLFEVGNLTLIYRLAGRLERDEARTTAAFDTPALHAATLYALGFVPLYTMLGWFEPMPLFFMLLGLELLLVGRAWGWMGSAVAAGLGFLTKLTPILLLPIAVRWFGARLSWDAARREWFAAGHPGNLLRPAAYVALFAAVVAGVGYPLVAANPDLALSSFRIQSIRPPWQSVWALLDGFYGYGLVPLDMRNLSGYDGLLWESDLPWTWIGAGFGLLYLWLYTRAYDWQRVRTPLALSAVSVILLFLYSKGWSPQFLLWIIVFIVLLLPSGRGIALVVVLSALNVIEANVFLIMLPDAHWLMAFTVLARTGLLLLLMVEFLAQVWPTAAAPQARRINAAVTWTALAAVLVIGVSLTPRAAHAYWERQLAMHPCRDALALIREDAAVTRLVVTQQPEVWRDLYPWLRDDVAFLVLDGYTPEGEPADVITARVDAITDAEFWWITREDLPYPGTSPRIAYEQAMNAPQRTVIAEQQAGACRLDRVVQLDATPLAVADVAGGPITLLGLNQGRARVGAGWSLVLYWQTSAPVDARYSVFTQLLDATDHVVAQQDNWPVQGLAPTDTWQPGTLIRDPYRLDLPADLPPGDYRLRVGLYDADGRRTLTLTDGRQADHLELGVTVYAP